MIISDFNYLHYICNKSMKPIVPLILLFACINALPNPAPYIHQAGRPLNIAHRGLASVFPENTL